jgi:D-arabinono-1,4-lactone oxidase
VLLFSTFKKPLLWLYPAILNSLQPLSKKGKAELFMDYTYRSLPMDNAANDVFLGTEFTEIWVPIEKTRQAMNLLKQLYDEKGIGATRHYSTELYAGIKSNFWLSPAYKQNMFRIDIFWYHNNKGDPSAKGGFFSQFWEAFRDENIPFRLHWGKYMPEYDYSQWSEYLRSQYPRWDDFMQLRKLRDPKNIFLSNYWSNHLFGKSKSEVVILRKQQTEIS